MLCTRFETQYTAIVRRIQDETGDMTTEIEEAAKGIGVIKAFGRARYAFDRYDATSSGCTARRWSASPCTPSSCGCWASSRT